MTIMLCRTVTGMIFAVLLMSASVVAAIGQDTDETEGRNIDFEVLDLDESTRSREEGQFQLVAMAGSQAELDAVNTIEVEPSALTKLSLSQTFLSEYPESELAYQVLGMRLDTYISLGNQRLVIETSEAALAAEQAFYDAKLAQFDDPTVEPRYSIFQHESLSTRTHYYQSLMNAHNQLGEFDRVVEYGELVVASDQRDWDGYGQTLDGPEAEVEAEAHRGRQLFYLQTIMAAYQNMNDADQTVEYARRALELDPGNVATLITLSSTMAERVPEDGNAQEDHLDRAEEYSSDAIESLERLLAGPVGDQMGEEQKGNLLSAVHSTLGLVYLHQEEFADARDSYERALEAMPNDPVAHYRLGVAYNSDDEIDAALESLARSVYLKGVTEPEARELLNRLYAGRNGSLDGLDQFIQREGQSIGN